MKVKIDRTKWMRGNTDAFSKLLVIRYQDGQTVPEESVGKMCCQFPTWIHTLETKIGNINDSEYSSDTEREEELTKIFAEYDIELEFIN